MLKQSSGSSVTSNVTVNMSLLYSVLAVVLAAVTELIFKGNVAVSAVAVVALILTLIYAGYSLFTAVDIALQEQDQDAASGICTSTFLGGFLLGLVALLLAPATNQNALLSGTAVIISVVSLGCLYFFVTSDVSQVKGSLENSGREQTPVPLPLPGLGGTAPSVYSPPPFTTPKVDRTTLPPLFKNDPLYQMAKPPTARLFYVVKEGEDACVISPDETRFALSDGASASSLPRPWATLLGQKWIEKPLGKTYINNLAGWLEEPRNLWEQWVKETWWSAVNERNRLTGDYPVQREDVTQILERGAFATLLGLEVNPQLRQWRALAIGDTCLFIVRRSSPWQILTSLPLERSTDFTNRPPLLSSQRHVDINSLLPHVKYKAGTYQEGDTLLMATDALAHWLLSQKEQGQPTWQILLEMRDQQSFTRFVESQRRDGMMEEDDTTLVVITL
jgi:hypothetical protein